MYAGKDVSFLQALEVAANTIPIIGDQNPTKILGLVHYSKDTSISSFRVSHDYNWTHRVCDWQDCIAAVTQLGEIHFNAIYIIRLGIGKSYKPRFSDVGLTKEYALGLPVPSGSFAKLLLTFDEKKRSYSID
ncbi:MAG: hypothetical protein U1D41_05970 [Nitrosomonas sp.]|uniref:hypothetical protein n=1 Tax=Nitrosomonas sp. TaxID=42353 RepID=UPI002AB97953|nr:hypothetical protein [Nitrosomonas sp.]MDZ4105699.1 hypothetical protein [Nitrosomonas sp.]